MATGTEAPAKKSSVDSGKVVVYTGTAHVREITAAQWKQAGIEDQKKVVWDKSNNWTVSVQEMSDAAVSYLDDNDDNLVLKDAQTK